MTDEIPQYRVLATCFFAPDLIQPGSIIATTAPPGPHLEPWNAAAVIRMEEWYNTEMDEIDPKTKDKTGKKIKPYASLRPAPYNPAPQQTAMVLELPEINEGQGQTLAQLQQRKSTDPRPPPARQFKKLSPVEKQSALPSATILERGPPISTVKGGPG